MSPTTSPPARPRLLILNLFAVHPPDTGAKVVIWNRIVELSRRFEVTFCFLQEPGRPIDDSSLEALRRHCEVLPLTGRGARVSPEGVADTIREPSVRLFSGPVRWWLREANRALRGTPFDLVELHSSCWYRSELAGISGRKVLVVHNDESEYWEAQARAARGPLARIGARFDALQARRQQAAAVAASDAIVALSRRDLERLGPGVGTRPTLVNHGGIDTTALATVSETSPQEPATMVCVATFVDAVAASIRRFADRVLPVIRAGVPDATLRLVGDHRDHPLLRPLRDRPGVVVTGRVDDVRPELRRAGIVVVPIESGGGVRVKVMEACAAGRAIVTTAKGAEGLGLVHGEHALVVPDLESMGPAVRSLLQDTELRDRLARRARRLALGRFDRVACHERLGDWYRQLLSGEERRRPGDDRTTMT